MTAETINEMTKTIAANYRFTYKDCTDDAMKRMMVSWFECLQDYTDEEGWKAFRICLRKCKNPPTIADIVEKIEKARDLKRPSKSEVWERILKAVAETKKQVYSNECGWRPMYKLKNEECRKIFSGLPQSVKKWLGFDAFCSYGDMNATALNVERARFMKEIDEIRLAIREDRQMALNDVLMIGEKTKP